MMNSLSIHCTIIFSIFRILYCYILWNIKRSGRKVYICGINKKKIGTTLVATSTYLPYVEGNDVCDVIESSKYMCTSHGRNYVGICTCSRYPNRFRTCKDLRYSPILAQTPLSWSIVLLE